MGSVMDNIFLFKSRVKVARDDSILG
jgi:hypothetical protein